MSDPASRLDAGGIPCHVLIDGRRTVSPRFVFAGYSDDVQGPFVRALLDAEGKLEGRFSGLLIEGPEGPVLVDAGNGRFAPEVDAGHLPGQMARVGVAPEDVRCVVITHGHTDHVGGLVAHGDEPAFPNARHVIHRVEAEFWTSPAAAELPHGAGVAATTALGSLLDAGLLDAIEGAARVTSVVEAIDAPGHTPGHLAVVVNEALLWAGDAFVSQLNVPHPEWVSLSDMDGPTNDATRRRLLERAAGGGLTLAASHMPVAGRIDRTADGFALRPSEIAEQPDEGVGP
jgi:glyoxylase-like metal-dependent hydrolase (beta-lactamase superfamily II)